METVSTILDVAGWLLMGVAAMIAAEALRLLAGWREGVEAATLRRRLADVEALRRSPLPPEGWELIMEAAETFRTYEAHHRAKASEAGRPEKAERNREMAEKLEALLARCPGLIRTRPRQPAPGVYREDQGEVPSIIREHIGDDPRQWDRAYAEAGIMPVSEYVRRHSTTRPVHGGYPG